MRRARSRLRLGLGLALAAPPAAAELRRTPVVAAVERVSPAVVNIATEQLVARREEPGAVADPLLEEYFRDFSEPRFEERYELLSLGSGTLVDARGYVLTNEHVINRASRIKVVLVDKREFEADVVATDPGSDLAVLKLRTEERLPHVSLGTSSDLLIGETLIAIGNPFGLSHTVTTGVLSARSRTVRAGQRVFGDFLQTDATINPGNSGGPLLNLEGSVIGIATAIYSSGHGIGFAIPADRARRVVESVLSHGSVEPAWIGVEVKPAGAELGGALGLPPGQGLVVTRVVERGPAAEARVRAGDVIAAAGGQPVGSAVELDAQIARSRGAVKLELLREGRRVGAGVRPLERSSPHLDRIAQTVLGLELEARPERAGLVVTRVAEGGRAQARGFAAGDVLYEMDGARVSDLPSFRDAFWKALAKRSVLLLVQHGESAYYVPLALD